ncbi:MAG: LptA/OstA family protein, partial [Desulfobulbales bacterium]|nr:LptA/OstA family protein [Desulfobulbales bacterium]
MLTTMRLFLIFTGFVLIFCWTAVAMGQKVGNTSTPIKVEADRMETSQEEGAVIFSGNVTAHQGDLVINADHMTV